MKKAFGVFWAAAFLMPLIVGAVTWQLDSSPFVFPGVGTIGEQQSRVLAAMAMRGYDFCKGVVTIHYTLPAGFRGAQLHVYTIGGTRVASFDVRPGSAFVRWNTAGSTVAAGVYLASMRYGNAENKLQLTVVK